MPETKKIAPLYINSRTLPKEGHPEEEPWPLSARTTLLVGDRAGSLPVYETLLAYSVFPS